MGLQWAGSSGSCRRRPAVRESPRLAATPGVRATVPSPSAGAALLWASPSSPGSTPAGDPSGRAVRGAGRPRSPPRRSAARFVVGRELAGPAGATAPDPCWARLVPPPSSSSPLASGGRRVHDAGRHALRFVSLTSAAEGPSFFGTPRAVQRQLKPNSRLRWPRSAIPGSGLRSRVGHLLRASCVSASTAGPLAGDAMTARGCRPYAASLRPTSALQPEQRRSIRRVARARPGARLAIRVEGG